MNYDDAKDQYAAVGVDTESVLSTLASIPISLHCWQGDDVAGFEQGPQMPGSGCLATGQYPGRARNFDELTRDMEVVASLVPAKLRLNLHASYATDNAEGADRDMLECRHFQSWVDWAKRQGMGIDFNPTFFSHRHAAGGFTLSHPDAGVRDFWVAHGIACRRIGAEMAKQLGSPCVNNLWIPDGYKDSPADRLSPRLRLKESLDRIFAEPVDAALNLDMLESKLFGIGVESYTVGSHEFYLAYAVAKGLGLCLDAGHFHPTESVADKLSSLVPFVGHLLLHVSRGVRWDSDHVVCLDDPTRQLLAEVVHCGALERIHVGMDYFDASIHRVAAWVIGARNTAKGLLLGLLEPRELLRQAESAGDLTRRLAVMEDTRSLPWGAVWEEFCRRKNCAGDRRWLAAAEPYLRRMVEQRG